MLGGEPVEFDRPHWVVSCPGFPSVYTYFPVGEGPPQWVIDEMVQDAYARTPVTVFNPRSSPDGTAEIEIVVQATTFLWVDEDLWGPVSATASLPGISVTTTAVPYRATWSGGDEPEVLVCHGPGVPYRFGIGGDDAQDDSCSVVFKRDSTVVPDRTIDVSVHWAVSYACTAFCTGGRLPDIVTQSSRPVVVTEIQVVET